MIIKASKKLIAIVIAIVLGFIWLSPMDSLAIKYTESGIKRAAATWVAARGASAAISIIRSTSIDAQAGLGVSTRPGEALAPVDNILEDISALMLLATISFAMQRLLIEVSGTFVVSLVLTALVITWAVLQWQSRDVPSWLSKITIALICLRLSVPVTALVNEAIYQAVLKNEYTTEVAKIPNSEESGATVPATESLSDKLKQLWAATVGLGAKIIAIKQTTSDGIDHYARLAAIFILQTIVLPILYLWLMLRLYQTLSKSYSSSQYRLESERETGLARGAIR